VLVVAVLAVGLGVAVLARHRPTTRDRLSPAATTILGLIGAVLVGGSTLDLTAGFWGGVLTVLAAALGAGAMVLVGAASNARLLAPLRDRTGDGPSVAERVEEWVAQRRESRGGWPALVAVRSVRRATEVRITGLAAEMSYYALISLVPLLTALGASLGSLERVLGTAAVEQIEQTLIDAVATVFVEQVASDVLGPLIEQLLYEERAGVALGSVLIALWLASRMFRAAIRALDDAYRVPERRSLVGQYVLGIALAMGAVITVLTILVLVVVGPLLGDGQDIADRFGLGTAFEVAWSAARWPVLAVITTTYLTVLYRYGPNVDTTWTRCLPGAVVGTVGLVLVAIGFAAYLRVVGGQAPGADGSQDSAVTVAAQVIGLILVGIVWVWLSGIVTLSGGVVNAELDRARQERAGGGGPEPLSRLRR